MRCSTATRWPTSFATEPGSRRSWSCADGRDPLDRGAAPARERAARLGALGARLSTVLPPCERLRGDLDRALERAVRRLARRDVPARTVMARARDAVRLRAR